MMTTQEELFNEAKELFGINSLVTLNLQNPGCIESEQHIIQDMIYRVNKHSTQKEYELMCYKTQCQEFNLKLKKAFEEGKIR
jgi:hypothetical protein